MPEGLLKLTVRKVCNCVAILYDHAHNNCIAVSLPQDNTWKQARVTVWRYCHTKKNDEFLKWFVQRDLVSDARNKQFGVIVGPTRTGKSAVVRNVCNKDPKGLLYVEVTEPGKFVQRLAQENKLENYTKHNRYSLIIQTLAYNAVVEVLREQANRSRKATGRMWQIRCCY